MLMHNKQASNTTHSEQEAQLSQRDRERFGFVALNILLNHPRSLKVIRNDTV